MSAKPESLGNCFETAAHLQLDDDSYTLCHAIVQGGPGPHWHAWVERTEEIDFPGYGPVTIVTVTDKANGNDWEGPAALYYSLGRIKNVHRYTRHEAAVEMVAANHYGPWVDWEDLP